MNSFMKSSLVNYFVKFFGSFIIFFYGTEALIGITAPGGLYVGFIDNYLNYINWLRSSLMHATAGVVSLFGYHAFLENAYVLRLTEGGAIKMVYSCIGYGVMSFWGAFIFANKLEFWKKMQWMAGGLLAIWIVNVARVALMVIAISHRWTSPFDLNNHTLFNIAAYSVIFTMIFLFDRSQKKRLQVTPQSNTVRNMMNIE